ncbi:hypothetical protein [Natronospora cellulosivora (SeqCode)]
MIDNKVLAGYYFKNDEPWKAPGHNSVLKDDDKYYIEHHIKGASNSKKLSYSTSVSIKFHNKENLVQNKKENDIFENDL